MTTKNIAIKSSDRALSYFMHFHTIFLEQPQPPIHRNFLKFPSTAQGGQAMRQRQQLSSHLLQPGHVPHPADAQATRAIGLAGGTSAWGGTREMSRLELGMMGII